MSTVSLNLPHGSIGRGYVCRAVIGTGGMGEVYLATDPATGSDVALKLIRADRAQRARALRRFTREVRAMAKLDHPSIVSVYDYGVHVDEKGVRRPFFVMEYLEGGTLRDFLKRGPSLEEALPVFDQMLSALAYAHARGVVHRDLKPENVILVERDPYLMPKILDFGIARMLDDDIVDEATIARLELELAEVRDVSSRAVIDELVTVDITDELDGPSSSFDRLGRPRDLQTSIDSSVVDPEHLSEESAELSARLTQMNQCVGTPAYLAPEQIRPRKYGVGPTSDLYAIGIMLFELIAGHRPYRARSPKELLKMHLIAPIPELIPRPALGVPPEPLFALVRQLMSKHPHLRPPFAADARRVLRAIMRGREIDAPLVPAFDRWASESTFLMPNPGLAEPGSSQLGERSNLPLKASTASLSLGLLSFREPPLVGRTLEQHAIWQHFVETHDTGRMQLVLVDGESGIGKTRLVRWLLERAEEMGLARALLAPYTAGPSGGGLRVAVERFLMCKGMEGDVLKKRVAETLRRLDLSDPWLVTGFLRFLNPPESSGGTAIQVSTSMSYTLIETLLERFAADRPVIFHLDDVHWAPDEAFELMHFLLENQRSRPFPALVVATLRSEDLLTNPTLASQLTTLTQHGRAHRMTLEPLAAEEIAQLTSALVPLPRETVNIIAERAAGQPMFAVQLLEHWAANGELRPSADGRTVMRTQNQPVPTRINDVVDRRIAAFLRSFEGSAAAQSAQSILEWMAIIGEPIEFALLHELARSEGATGEDVDAVWEAALIDGICVEDALDATLCFDHQIIGGQLLDWARAHNHYHGRQEHCADAKLRMVGRDPIQLHYEVYRHLREAGSRTKAWRHLVYSARCSLDRNQDRMARQRLKKALDALEEHVARAANAAAVVVSKGERFQARHAYVQATLRLNLYEEVDQQLALLREEAANDTLHQGLFALIESDLLSRRGKVEAACDRYRETLPYFAEAGFDDHRAKALSGLGATLAKAGHLRAGLEALEEAEPLARASGDENLLADVLLSRGVIYFDAGSHDLFAQYFGEALTIFTSKQNLIGVGDAHVQWGRAELLLGNLDAAQAHFEEARSTRTVIGDRRGVIHVLNGLGEVARGHHDLARAARVYTRALDLLETCGADEDDAIIRTNLGIVEFEQGRFDEARVTLTAAATAFQSLGMRPFETVVSGLLACTEAKVGDFEQCRYWVMRIQRMDLDRAPADRDYAFAVASAAQLCLDAGHVELAVALLFQASDAFRLLGEEDARQETDSLLVSISNAQ